MSFGSKLAEFFGYEHSRLGYYRDMVLSISCLLGVSMILGIVLGEVSWDYRREALWGLAMVVGSLLLTPNKLQICVNTAALVAAGGWYGLFMRPFPNAIWMALAGTALFVFLVRMSPE